MRGRLWERRRHQDGDEDGGRGCGAPPDTGHGIFDFRNAWLRGSMQLRTNLEELAANNSFDKTSIFIGGNC